MRRFSILSFLILSLSFSAFSSVDQFLGSYKATKGIGSATISKKLVREATLFEPAKYEYLIEVEHDKHELYTSVALDIIENGNSLSAWTREDCDDPGCYYLDNIEILVNKPTPRSKARVTIEYSGNHFDDGDVGDYEFDNKIIFIKTN